MLGVGTASILHAWGHVLYTAHTITVIHKGVWHTPVEQYSTCTASLKSSPLTSSQEATHIQTLCQEQQVLSLWNGHILLTPEWEALTLIGIFTTPPL